MFSLAPNDFNKKAAGQTDMHAGNYKDGAPTDHPMGFSLQQGEPPKSPYKVKDGKAPYWGDGNGQHNEKLDAWGDMAIHSKD